MNVNLVKPRKALNKAFLKVKSNKGHFKFITTLFLNKHKPGIQAEGHEFGTITVLFLSI